ncbi:MAG: class I SAM-dependent methyltransferase [Anaerolineaceae bacterium]|nr:class I SAM-dependent methyltransferase [Anaerolineaceae bacterium]
MDYESYWSGTHWLNVDQIEHSVLRRILPATGYRVVDIGCGYGRLADCYMDRFEHAVLLDSSASLLSQAAERTGRCGARVVADLHRLPFRDGSFDTGLMVRVFHHVEDPGGCLREVNRVLTSNGQFVLNYRNKRDVLSMIRWLSRRRTYNPFKKDPVEASLMVTAHHPGFIDQAMREAGFRIVRSAGTTGALVRLAAGKGPARLALALSVRASPLFGGAKLTSWLFCLARKGDSK